MHIVRFREARIVKCRDLDAGRLEAMAAKFLARGYSAQVLAGDIGDSAYPARLTDALAARDIGALILGLQE